MCRSQNPPNFSEKKNGKDQNSVFCTKNNILFLVSTRNDNISRGCATKTEFPEGRGVRFESQYLENQEGRGGHRKNPFRGGVWIFSGTTHCVSRDNYIVLSGCRNHSLFYRTQVSLRFRQVMHEFHVFI